MNQPIVKKLKARSVSSEAGSSLAPVQKREVVLSVDAWALEGMKKEAHVTVENPQGSTFSIICDEGPYLGGEDSAPPPLAYFSAGAACCVLTQLSRYATMTKLKIDKISIKVKARFSMDGSALKGTLAGRGLGFESHVSIESDEPLEKIADLIRIGEQSCFVMQSLIHPVPCDMHVELNGHPFQF